MLWFVFALASGICVAIMNTITRRLKDLNTMSLLCGRYLIATLFAIPLLFFTGIPNVSPTFYPFILIASFADVVAVGLLIKAIRSAELSRTFPFVSFTPLFLILTGFLVLGELPSLIGALGIISVVLGAYLLNLKEGSNFFTPFIRIIREKGSRYVLIAAFLFSLVGPALKKAILSSSISFTTAVYFILSAAALTPFFIRKRDACVRDCKENFTLLAITGVALFLTIIAISLAFRLTLAVYVVSIKRLSIPFTILAGYYFFREKNLVRNLTAATIMMLGTILISIGS